MFYLFIDNLQFIF